MRIKSTYWTGGPPHNFVGGDCSVPSDAPRRITFGHTAYQIHQDWDRGLKTKPEFEAFVPHDDDWAIPELGCLRTYVLVSRGGHPAITYYLTSVQLGDPDPALFDDSGYEEVAPSVFDAKWNEAAGFDTSDPDYQAVMQRADENWRNMWKILPRPN